MSDNNSIAIFPTRAVEFIPQLRPLIKEEIRRGKLPWSIEEVEGDLYRGMTERVGLLWLVEDKVKTEIVGYLLAVAQGTEICIWHAMLDKPYSQRNSEHDIAEKVLQQVEIWAAQCRIKRLVFHTTREDAKKIFGRFGFKFETYQFAKELMGNGIERGE